MNHIEKGYILEMHLNQMYVLEQILIHLIHITLMLIQITLILIQTIITKENVITLKKLLMLIKSMKELLHASLFLTSKRKMKHRFYEK